MIRLYEIAECKSWIEQSEKKDFYLTDWQKKQCEFHNIDLK